MALLTYYLRSFLLGFFYRKRYHTSKKDFYERQLNFSFLDWIFTPEGNKRTDAAEFRIASPSIFTFAGIELCSNRRKVTNKLGNPNYIFNIKAKAGIKVCAVFYKLSIAQHNCLLQLYFVENKLYCIDLKFVDNNYQKKQTLKETMEEILNDVLEQKIKEEVIERVLRHSFSDLLADKFYMHVENYFGFRIRVIPHFSKYRSLISHDKNNRTGYHHY